MSDQLYQRRKDITEKVIGCAIEVHKALGPGLLETIYRECLYSELCELGLSVQREHHMPITYKNKIFEKAFRLDLFVENFLVVELKAVEKILPIHEAQVLTYMRLTKAPVGLIMNFNAELLKQGLKRMTLEDMGTVKKLETV